MNALLARQLRKFRPRVDPTDPAWQDLIAAIASAHDELQQDRRQLEPTLEVVSTELTEANERLRRESESQLASINDYFQQVLSSQQGMILCVRRTPKGFLHTLWRGELARRLDLTPEHVEGCTVEEVAAEQNVAELDAAYERAWSGQNTAFSSASPDAARRFSSPSAHPSPNCGRLAAAQRENLDSRYLTVRSFQPCAKAPSRSGHCTRGHRVGEPKAACFAFCS